MGLHYCSSPVHQDPVPDPRSVAKSCASKIGQIRDPWSTSPPSFGQIAIFGLNIVHHLFSCDLSLLVPELRQANTQNLLASHATSLTDFAPLLGIQDMVKGNT